ncbi:MAG: hypothetical protein HYT20_01810 [Candidatus Nealsonbacteria bacterium]|nr:hypothetical protein [Candidatus Nealsonbacteria bacterium]
MNKTDFSKRIYLGITGGKNIDWQSKLKEINQLGIKEAAVFLERFNKQERDNLRRFLPESSIKKVPLVHLRSDTGKDEVRFFIDNFQTEYFNIHEDHFNLLDQWEGYWDKLYLEMNYDSEIAKNVKVRKIGGFCVDLAHFKSAIARGSDEASYIFSEKDKIKFASNHLGGYSPETKSDLHVIANLKNFDYLATLPKWVFSDVIAIEVDNSIKEQMVFRDYILKLLNGVQ